ncbi:AEC family transporter [uncultured Sneathiella sp.]|uniref:AEC family transporter n=1 Tax=uncultured Sneathiella sp. TaxID=879315 RepID=UPI0030EEDC0D
MEILALTLPVFAIVVIGYACVRAGVVTEAIAVPLVQFVYRICLPALMFHIVASDPIDSLLNWDFWIAFGGGTLLVLAIVALLGWRWLGESFAHRTILAFSTVQTNTGFIALPILHAVFGAKGVPPAAIANLIIAAADFHRL